MRQVGVFLPINRERLLNFLFIYLFFLRVGLIYLIDDLVSLIVILHDRSLCQGNFTL